MRKAFIIGTIWTLQEKNLWILYFFECSLSRTVAIILYILIESMERKFRHRWFYSFFHDGCWHLGRKFMGELLIRSVGLWFFCRGKIYTLKEIYFIYHQLFTFHFFLLFLFSWVNKSKQDFISQINFYSSFFEKW